MVTSKRYAVLGDTRLAGQGKRGDHAMSSLTIPDCDDDLRRLDELAAQHGQTPEAEARTILPSALAKRGKVAPDNLYDAIRAIVEPYGGFEFDLPPGEYMPVPIKFD
jgi:plasmid stability protein